MSNPIQYVVKIFFRYNTKDPMFFYHAVEARYLDKTFVVCEGTQVYTFERDTLLYTVTEVRQPCQS